MALKALSVILPKKKANEKGTSYTSTYQPSNSGQVLSAPQYREHLTDIFSTRQSDNSQALLVELFRHDPDVSAAVNAYLTTANTAPQWAVYDTEGMPDREGQKVVTDLITRMTTRTDYSTGFEVRQSLKAMAESFRYMVLLRGGIGSELLFDKTLFPRGVRHVDLSTVQWYEKQPGLYKPVQTPPGSNDEINLDVPTFFATFYRQSPTTIYTYSPFVAAINTVAARQQVINDLYRIMTIVGYPRITVEVAEEVLRKNAPANIANSEDEMRKWLNSRLAEIQTSVSNLRSDQAFIHWDSTKPDVLNKDGPSKSLDVTAIIETLNAMNQAALKTMATVIGRGTAGVNTASVEALIFKKNAEELNQPVADILSQMLTLALRLTGSDSIVEFSFAPVELRPETELESQMTMRQSRLLELLSEGIITDDDFHLMMFGWFRPDSVPELSGTKFFTSSGAPDASKASPNSDPLGRAITPDNANAAKAK